MALFPSLCLGSLVGITFRNNDSFIRNSSISRLGK